MLDVSSVFNIINVLNGMPMALNGIGMERAPPCRGMVHLTAAGSGYGPLAVALMHGTSSGSQFGWPLCGISIPLGIWEAADLIGDLLCDWSTSRSLGVTSQPDTEDSASFYLQFPVVRSALVTLRLTNHRRGHQ